MIDLRFSNKMNLRFVEWSTELHKDHIPDILEQMKEQAVNRIYRKSQHEPQLVIIDESSEFTKEQFNKLMNIIDKYSVDLFKKEDCH